MISDIWLISNVWIVFDIMSPFKNYTILLGGGGRSPKDFIRLQGGEVYTKRLHWVTRRGASWFNHSIESFYRSARLQVLNNFEQLDLYWSILIYLGLS